MILTFDIGNTHIVTGIYSSEGVLLTNFRIATENNITEDQLFSYIKNIIFWYDPFRCRKIDLVFFRPLDKFE